MQDTIQSFLLRHGVGQVGFCELNQENPFDLPYAVSFTVPLSDAVVDSITDAPTHTYFHHYRSVNSYIDHLALRVGLLLQAEGYRYVAIPASQSVEGLQGIFSHKYAAVRAGLGAVGKSGLFLSSVYGPRVRLGTVLTDYPFSVSEVTPVCPCGDCNLCAKACPAMAITGQPWTPDAPREEILDVMACSRHMKEHYQKIGRGAVCGICMKVCPKGHKNQ